MTMSEAKKRANKKWNDANLTERYDRIQVVVPKGKKEVIKEHADSRRESVNAFINRAIAETMERDQLESVREIAEMEGQSYELSPIITLLEE